MIEYHLVRKRRKKNALGVSSFAISPISLPIIFNTLPLRTQSPLALLQVPKMTMSGNLEIDWALIRWFRSWGRKRRRGGLGILADDVGTW